MSFRASWSMVEVMDAGDLIVLVVRLIILLIAVTPFVLLRRRKAVIKYPVLIVSIALAMVLYWGFDNFHLGLYEDRVAAVTLLAKPCYAEVDKQVDQKIEGLNHLEIPSGATEEEIKEISDREIAKLNTFSIKEKEKCIDKYWDQYEFK